MIGFGKLKGLFGGGDDHRFPAFEMDQTLRVTADDVDGNLLSVVPYQGNDNPQAAAGAIRAFTGSAGTDMGHSMETWFDENQVRFIFRAATDTIAENLADRIATNYPNSQVEDLTGRSPAWPDMNAGDMVTMGTAYKVHPKYPYDYIPMWRQDKDGIESRTPMEEIIQAMLSVDSTRVVAQTMLKPVPTNWADGRYHNGESADQVARELTEPIPHDSIWGYWEEEAPDSDRKLSKIIGNELERNAFMTSIRFMAVSPDPDEAMNRAESVAAAFETEFESPRTNSHLEVTPVSGRTEGTLRKNAHDHIQAMTERIMDDRDGSILGPHEEAGLWPIVPGSTPVPKIQWVHTRSGDEIPAEAPNHASTFGDVGDRPEGW